MWKNKKPKSATLEQRLATAETQIRELAAILFETDQELEGYLQEAEKRLANVYYRNYDGALNKHYAKYMKYMQGMEHLRGRLDKSIKDLDAATDLFNKSTAKRLLAKFEDLEEGLAAELRTLSHRVATLEEK